MADVACEVMNILIENPTIKRADLVRQVKGPLEMGVKQAFEEVRPVLQEMVDCDMITIGGDNIITVIC